MFTDNNISRNIWGPIAWNLLHSFSINNNIKMNDSKKHNYYIFYTTFSYILPCIICSEHYAHIINSTLLLEEDKIKISYLKRWIYKIHNIINKKLKKNKYSYKNLLRDHLEIKTKDVFFFIINVYKSFDYKNMCFYEYDKIYNFFLNFCLLYPDKNIKDVLKKLINKKDFISISTPLEFSKWFDLNIRIDIIN